MSTNLSPAQIAEIKSLLETVGLTVSRKRKTRNIATGPVRYVPDWLAADDAAQDAHIAALKAAKGFARASTKAACIRSAKGRAPLSLAYRAFILGRDPRPYALAESIADLLNGKPRPLALGVDRARRRVRAFDKAAAYARGVGSGPAIAL